MKISVILATYNEEKNIKDCLNSVRGLADEIVIVDGTSTDKTVEVAKKFTKKIIIRENPPMFHINKQLAISKATGEWILYLDADERVSDELKEEILSVVKNKKFNGFWIPRKNIIFGKWIEHTGWWPDYQLRLFKKGKAYLPCKSVHEQPELVGEAAFLKQPLIHYNYQTVWQFINKLNNLYTENDKAILARQDKAFSRHDALRFPANEFFKRFFLEEGYKDGLHGLALSILQSFSAFVSWAKLWEAQGFKTDNEENIINAVEAEQKRLNHDWRYWLLTAKIAQAKGVWKKFSLKIKRKISL